MRILRVWAMIVLLAFSVASAMAQSFSLANGDSRSAFRDVSNLNFFGNGLNYNVNLDTAAGDPDTYINAISLTPGANWDPNLNLNAPTTDFTFRNTTNNTNGTYTLGTAIAADTHWNFSGAFRSGSVDASVADGVYTTTLDILGGADAAAQNTLASFTLNLQVTQKLDVGVTMVGAPDIINPGQTTQFSMTVTNNMTGLDFLSNTWYVSSFTDAGNTNNLQFRSFDGDWFGKQIAPGTSRTDLHSTWAAAMDQALGVYNGNLGVIGGLYSGDFYLLNNSPLATITVAPVPGPSALIPMVMGLSFMAPFFRRRK